MADGDRRRAVEQSVEKASSGYRADGIGRAANPKRITEVL